jgi:hypothetical protein
LLSILDKINFSSKALYQIHPNLGKKKTAIEKFVAEKKEGIAIMQ